jgi:hypothetical protein
VRGQALVVADGAAVAGDPGQGALDHPPAGQHFEGVKVIRALDDVQPQAQAGPGPAGLWVPIILSQTLTWCLAQDDGWKQPATQTIRRS